MKAQHVILFLTFWLCLALCAAEEIAQLKAKAEKGDAKAQNELGEKYYYGEGVKKDFKEAIKWYRKAVEQNHAEAQFSLGWMYDIGQGVLADSKEAVKWYQKAADQGFADAQHNLGFMYEKGKGVNQDSKEAFKWFRKAALQGHAKAQNKLGLMYDNGSGIEEDNKEAMKWYRKAAAQEHSNAQYNLGVMYYNGEGVGEDIAQAYQWWYQAAEQGHEEAKKWKGKAADKLTPGEILAQLKELANKGVASAQYELGEKYYYGKDVRKDFKEAISWYAKAAEQNHAEAQFSLGVMNQDGKGVEQDDKEAVKWYRKAANQGDDGAQYALGWMYDNGSGIEEDNKEAVKWYRKAALQGNDAGQYNLGVMYDNGSGIEEDNKEAVKWYRKAAGQRYTSAQYNLGVMYWKGEGVGKDMAQAYLWMSVAAEQDHEKAKEWKGKAADKLGAGWVKEAEKWKKEWSALKLARGLHETNPFAALEKKFGFQVYYKVDDIFTGDPSPEDNPAKPIRPDELKRLPKILERALAKYPIWVVRKHLNRVRFVEDLLHEGGDMAGLSFANRKSIYVDVSNENKPRSDKEVEATLHHEFAHILHAEIKPFPEGEWKGCTPSGSEYKKGLENKSDWELWEDGYYSNYSRTDMEEDFCEFSELVFEPRKAKLLFNHYPALNKKFGVWLKVYQKIDKNFTEERLFPKGLINPDLPHPEVVRQNELLELKEGIYVYLPTGKPYSGKVETHHDNGRLQYVWKYKAGKLDGTWEKWHDNGQQMYEANKKGGKFEGPFTKWYDNGNKEQEGLYRDGKLVEDSIKEWDRDGTPK